MEIKRKRTGRSCSFDKAGGTNYQRKQRGEKAETADCGSSYVGRTVNDVYQKGTKRGSTTNARYGWGEFVTNRPGEPRQIKGKGKRGPPSREIHDW